MSKGYIFAEVAVHDAGAQWSEYTSKAQATLDPYGGTFLIRGKNPRVMEGEENTSNLVVILEFESQQKADDWYASAAYQEILPLRLRNATSRLVCFSSVD